MCSKFSESFKRQKKKDKKRAAVLTALTSQDEDVKSGGSERGAHHSFALGATREKAIPPDWI